MVSSLTLDLPWLPDGRELADELILQRGPVEAVRFDDGLVLRVAVLDPQDATSVNDLIRRVEDAADVPGQLALVAGAVPVEWRSALRLRNVSWLDAGGALQLYWPRLRVSADRVSTLVAEPERSRAPVPLQKSQGLVAQELCIAGVHGRPQTLSDLAEATGLDPSSVVRAVEQLARHGLVAKHRRNRRVEVVVQSPPVLADVLASRTTWKRLPRVPGYLWGASSLGVAERLSAAAEAKGVDVAITGRVGAMLRGVLGTNDPTVLRVRVRHRIEAMADILGELGIESVSEAEANIVLAADRWGLGSHRASVETFHGTRARVAHPLRIWCDLRDELRGEDFAAQMWSEVIRG